MPHPLTCDVTCGDATSIAVSKVHHTSCQDYVWENASGQLLAAVFDKESGNIFVGQSNGAVSVVRLTAGKPRILGRHAGRVTGLCIRSWSSGVNLVATCSADNTVKIWTQDDHRALHSSTACLQTLHAHKAAVTCVAAVHECLVSGGIDGAVLLWKPEANSLLQPNYQCVVSIPPNQLYGTFAVQLLWLNLLGTAAATFCLLDSAFIGC
jgi:WD40 repeat protein